VSDGHGAGSRLGWGTKPLADTHSRATETQAAITVHHHPVRQVEVSGALPPPALLAISGSAFPTMPRVTVILVAEPGTRTASQRYGSDPYRCLILSPLAASAGGKWGVGNEQCGGV
jgi:hypothetical protein